MIFVTVGTNETPFDRLVQACEPLAREEVVVVQRGSSAFEPAGVTCVDFLPFEELVQHVRRARVVVTHAGVGSVIVALANGKRPVVVPRLRRFGEAVDDHQLALGRRFEQEGLVRLVEDPTLLSDAVRQTADIAPSLERGSNLVHELRDYLAAVIGHPPDEKANFFALRDGPTAKAALSGERALRSATKSEW
jgi:UDP-N-acetylglucosamine transferase subunit ALG13